MRQRLSASAWATLLLLLGCHLTNRTLQAKRPAVDSGTRSVSAPPAGLVATGTEPFWQLRIDPERGIRFNALGGDSLNTPPVPGVRLPGGTGSRYRAQTEAGPIEVLVYDESCTNSMSGQVSPRRVEVLLSGKSYRGCGRPQ